MSKRTCPVQKKLIYLSKTAAIRAALSYSRKRGQALRVYFHKDCKGYHLTHHQRRDVDTHTGRASA